MVLLHFSFRLCVFALGFLSSFFHSSYTLFASLLTFNYCALNNVSTRCNKILPAVGFSA